MIKLRNTRHSYSQTILAYFQTKLAYFQTILCLNFTLLIFISVIHTVKGKDLVINKHDKNSPGSESILTQETTGSKTIKIGLLLPVPPDKDLLARSALQGAELAVIQANETGGYRGQPFELIIRTADGLWGAGSKESVDFVYEDQVVAIVTAVDGRNAHLVEQVSAKSHVVQVATRATEETLSQAFVPWFFRIVPNDVQQAEALVDEIFIKKGYSDVYMMYEDGYEFKTGAVSFEKVVKKNGFKLMDVSLYKSSETGALLPGFKKIPEALVVFGSFESSHPILDRIKENNTSVQVYGALSMTRDGLIGAGYTDGCEDGIFISSKFCFTTAGLAFKDSYTRKYGLIPNPAASYAYDGINLIVEAVRQVGPDYEKIGDALKEIDYSNAATGRIQFDIHGNRISPVFLIRLIKGHPVILNP
jgi:branched-chain amino acid transport system substrate-binding protein